MTDVVDHLAQVASKWLRALRRDQIPLRRLVRPEEVAAAALFLASDESSSVAGAKLVIYGSMSQI
jgi:NAD(P)-dependent dehydrogenase (short-subunit alcohol dehydrogenase family)